MLCFLAKIYAFKFRSFCGAGFVKDFVSQLAHPLDAYPFVILLMAVYGERKVGDEPGENLDHQAMMASRYQGINTEMALPPGEKFLDLPAKFICLGNLLSGQIKAVSGNPVGLSANLISYKPQRFFRPLDPLNAKHDFGIIENIAAFSDREFLQTGFYGV